MYLGLDMSLLKFVDLFSAQLPIIAVNANFFYLVNWKQKIMYFFSALVESYVYLTIQIL